MELYQEIIADMIANEKTCLSLENIKIDASVLIHDECYEALSEIKDVLGNDTLSDRACYQRIEQIIRTFEKLGTNSLFRHKK